MRRVGIGLSACRSKFEATMANCGPQPVGSSVRTRLTILYMRKRPAQLRIRAGGVSKKTNTKVLVAIVERTCSDMVASTGGPEETLSAVADVRPGQNVFGKFRAHRLPQTPLVPRKGLSALSMKIDCFSWGVRAS